MERNQAIGLTLMFLILFGYFTFFAEPPTQVSRTEGTPAQTEQADSLVAKGRARLAGDTAVAASAGQIIRLENEHIALGISTQGGGITYARLKAYKNYHGGPLVLLDSSRAMHQYRFAPEGQVPGVNLKDLVATGVTRTPSPAGGETLELTFAGAQGEPAGSIEYRLPSGGYLLKTRLRAPGAAPGTWQIDLDQKMPLVEKDLEQSRNASTINYHQPDGGFDNLGEANQDLEQAALTQPTTWLTHKQKFFLTGIISRGVPFSGAELSTIGGGADTSTVKRARSIVSLASASAADNGFDYYLGPNHYKTLMPVAEEFERNVYLGFPVIRWINKYLVVNVFYFLEGFKLNYGIIILFLVMFVRVLIFPLGYKSYLSTAKMRAIKPELDAIKEKHSEDMMAQQQEQMKLYQQVGINPISGCVPLLLQIPVLLAMFNFFPNAIELRGESLWWAEDLSTYDSIATLPFALPGYGDHVSLFTILMTLSTLAITYVNSQTTAITGPMATVQYVMPIVFMFILNSLPAGLNYYYLISNIFSLGQQYLIRGLVDDQKVRAKLVANRERNQAKPEKKGGFAQRLESAMRQAEEARRQQPTNGQAGHKSLPGATSAGGRKPRRS